MNGEDTIGDSNKLAANNNNTYNDASKIWWALYTVERSYQWFNIRCWKNTKQQSLINKNSKFTAQPYIVRAIDLNRNN